MDGAILTLIAVPQALAAAARQAAATWDPAGAPSMFNNPTLQDGAGNLYVFSYGWIADVYAPAIQTAMEAEFPSALIVAAFPFESALTQAGLVRVQQTMSALA